MNLDREYIEKLFTYSDGKLYRRVTRGRITANTAAGSKRKDGYFEVQIDGRKYLAHRVIYLLAHGTLPQFIDHINGDRSDNRIDNLRDATRSQNGRNCHRRKDSKSGVKGVSWYGEKKKWVVRLYVDGSNKFFGAFDTLEDARVQVETVRTRVHGQFARHG